MTKSVRESLVELSNNKYHIYPTDNVHVYHIYIYPTLKSMYRDGVFIIEMTITDRFPLQAPRMRMITNIFHPNVCIEPKHKGMLYLPILYENWRIPMDIRKLLDYIYSLFNKPDCDPLAINNREAYDLYLYYPETFKILARKFTLKYAQ